MTMIEQFLDILSPYKYFFITENKGGGSFLPFNKRSQLANQIKHIEKNKAGKRGGILC